MIAACPPFALGWIAQEWVAARWMYSILETLTAYPVKCIPAFGATGALDAGRDLVVDQFLGTSEADWLLFVDSDMVFEPQHVARLLATAERKGPSIVGGAYRAGEGWIVASDFAGKRIETTALKEAALEVQFLGMGFTAIHRNVLTDGIRFDVHGRAPGVYSGEDVTFCRRARERGYRVWLDAGCRLGHVKTATFYIA